jgi:hypothetical protein
MLDLYRARREDLVEVVVAQREALADRDRRVAALEAELATRRATIAELTARVGELVTAPNPRGMPGLKPPREETPPRRARKRRARGCARARMTPTAQQGHALAACPDCGAPLAGGTVKRTREVIEVPLGPAVVTEHVYLERRCPDCGRRCVPGPELDGIVDGQSRLGVGLVSLVAVLREEARLPFAVIQRLVRVLHGLELSVGALVGAVQRVATRAGPAVERLREAIRASPVVHADETGWREDGHNGYAWTFSTPDVRYFVRGTREKAVLERELGTGFEGVLVSDFYGAYTNYEGRHQYCWAHLLRDVHDLAQQRRRDAGVAGGADAVHRLYERARAFASADPAARRQAARGFRAELAAIGAPYLPLVAAAAGDGTTPAPAAPAAVPPQRVPCQRIERHLAELFVFVEDPAVPATNNAAERSLRHLVVGRKISGGTRSDAGSTTKMTLASLFGTWHVQGLNPLHECRQLLAAPQP